MFELLARTIQFIFGFNGGKSIEPEPEQRRVDAEGQPAPAAAPPVEQPKLSSAEVSKLRKIVAYSLGTLAGLSVLPTMIDLCTDALEKMINGTESPEFLATWKRIINNHDVGTGIGIGIITALAILAMGPFNAYYTVIGVLSKSSNEECNKILATIRNADTYALEPILKVAFGLPIAAMMLKACEEFWGKKTDGFKDTQSKIAAAMMVWGDLAAGHPTEKAVVGQLKSELPRLLHSVKRGFFARNKFIKDPAALTPEQKRMELLSVLYDALGAVQLLHSSDLKGISPEGTAAEIIANLLTREPSKLKIWLGELIMPALGFYLTYYGTSFFGDLAKDAISHVVKAFSGDPDAGWAQKLGAVCGQTSVISYILLWGLLMKDAVHRPFMRMFAEGKLSNSELKGLLQKTTDFSSWREAANYSLAYIFGSGLAITNIPFTHDIRTAICAILSNWAVSAAGFNAGRKDMGLMTKDIHDQLGGKIFGLIERIATMSDAEVTKTLNEVRGTLNQLETEGTRLLPNEEARLGDERAHLLAGAGPA